jgi:hypothetical protein
MKSKAHFINELCKLKNINPACEEAQSFENLKIVELLVEINKFNKKQPSEEKDVVNADDEPNVSQHAGCRF